MNLLLRWTWNDLGWQWSRNVKEQNNNPRMKAFSSDVILTSPLQANKNLDQQKSGPFFRISAFTTCFPQYHRSGKVQLKDNTTWQIALGFWLVCCFHLLKCAHSKQAQIAVWLYWHNSVWLGQKLPGRIKTCMVRPWSCLVNNLLGQLLFPRSLYHLRQSRSLVWTLLLYKRSSSRQEILY